MYSSLKRIFTRSQSFRGELRLLDVFLSSAALAADAILTIYLVGQHVSGKGMISDSILQTDVPKMQANT